MFYNKILTENSIYGEKGEIQPGNTCPYCVSIELASIMYPMAYTEVFLTQEEINKLKEYGK